MKFQWKVCVTAALCCTVSLSTGCQSLPWVGNRNDETVFTAEQYIEQASANIQYDTAVDMVTDYQPPSAPSISTAPSLGPPSLPSGGGSCCR